MTELNILNQLRFSRSEFERGFAGVSEEDSRHRFMPINSIAWIVGHMAWHEQHYWLKRAQGIIPFPKLEEVAAYGKPPVDVSHSEVIELWKAAIKESDAYLTGLTKGDLLKKLVVNGKQLHANIGTMMTRVIYHYWYHIGEMQAIRQLLGHKDLPSFVGNGIETVGQFYLDE
jgi:hypothetical protein